MILFGFCLNAVFTEKTFRKRNELIKIVVTIITTTFTIDDTIDNYIALALLD